ncbi:MAG: hypothetical protein ABF820_08575 [Sporolactobacillus sp.]
MVDKSICELVRNELPDADMKLCVKIINRTNFPFCSLERLEYQIKYACIEYRKEKAMGS